MHGVNVLAAEGKKIEFLFATARERGVGEKKKNIPRNKSSSRFKGTVQFPGKIYGSTAGSARGSVTKGPRIHGVTTVKNLISTLHTVDQVTG